MCISRLYARPCGNGPSTEDGKGCTREVAREYSAGIDDSILVVDGCGSGTVMRFASAQAEE